MKGVDLPLSELSLAEKLDLEAMNHAAAGDGASPANSCRHSGLDPESSSCS